MNKEEKTAKISRVLKFRNKTGRVFCGEFNVARLLWEQDVGGSNPLAPTTSPYHDPCNPTTQSEVRDRLALRFTIPLLHHSDFIGLKPRNPLHDGLCDPSADAAPGLFLSQSFHSRVLVKRQIAFNMPHRTGRFFSRLGGHLNLSRKRPYRLQAATPYDPTRIAVNHFCNYPALLTISGARRTPSPQHGGTHETTSAYKL